VNDLSSVDLVDWLSTLAIRVTIAAALIGAVGAVCTSFKIKWNHRVSQKDTLDAAQYRKWAARVEIAANLCQYVAIVTAIAGGFVAFAKLGHDRDLRVQAKEEKARLEDGLTETARAAASLNPTFRALPVALPLRFLSEIALDHGSP
jgi:hypothetical protein